MASAAAVQSSTPNACWADHQIKLEG